MMQPSLGRVLDGLALACHSARDFVIRIIQQLHAAESPAETRHGRDLTWSEIRGSEGDITRLPYGPN
jgi:hypothetical protein